MTTSEQEPRVWDVAKQIETLDRKIGERESVERVLEQELDDHRAQTQRLRNERLEAAIENGVVGDGYDAFRKGAGLVTNMLSKPHGIGALDG